jgi:alkylation response protein AidB-like acyl-CoA dehydrogenase
MSLQAHEKFGDQVPYGDPSWYQGAPTPYYTASHVVFRAKMRAFVEKELKPYVDEWDEAGDYPEELREKAYKAGILGAIWPAEHGGTPPPDFDAFHDFIWMDELCRCGGGGILWAVFTGFGIALPPVLKHGTPEMRAKVARPVISGQKVMSLAISEPWVGSDVAGLQTTAVKSPDGKHYIVNGAKKWITGGMKASFFTVAVRTGGEGVNGISLILMEAGAKGFETRRMKTQGWWTSGTAYLDFDDVYVPVENLIGIENKGFQYIMHNFNHE